MSSGPSTARRSRPYNPGRGRGRGRGVAVNSNSEYPMSLETGVLMTDDPGNVPQDSASPSQRGRSKQTARRSFGRRGGARGKVVTTGGLVTVDVLESDYLSSDTDNIDPFDAESGVRERERELRSLMPPLVPANGRPIVLSATVGSITMLEMPGEDPRVQAISHDFPISVHPLRLPNSRALFSNLSSVSVVDYGFVRLAGLLHEMVPLRHEIDKVEIKDFHSDFTYVVYGYVTILFDAGGFEFEEKCWVVNLMRASQFVDLIVGMDWLTANAISTSFSRKGVTIEKADARRVRAIDEKYVTQ